MKGKEKLQAAAAKLFMEKGYENTTVQEIASLAGETERTFFRQFKDKSDVLFDTNNEMGQQLAAFITDNFDVEKKPLKLAVEGFVSTSEFFDGSRERVLARNQIIQSNPDLQERELLKGQVLIASVTNSLSNQQQITEASAVIAVLGDLESYNKAEETYGQAVKAGYMPADTAKSFLERVPSMYPNLPQDVIRSIVLTDCGLVSMQLMLAARAKGYDTVAMGGYDKTKFIEASAFRKPMCR